MAIFATALASGLTSGEVSIRLSHCHWPFLSGVFFGLILRALLFGECQRFDEVIDMCGINLVILRISRI